MTVRFTFRACATWAAARAGHCSADGRLFHRPFPRSGRPECSAAAPLTFTIDGRSLSGAKDVIFDAAGMTAKISDIKEVPEKITGPRAGVDLAAQVPPGKKATARLEVTVAKDVEPGIHRFRIQTPLGTSNMAVIAIGSLPEIQIQKIVRGTDSATGKTASDSGWHDCTPGESTTTVSRARPAKRSCFRSWPRSWVQNSSRCWCCAILPASN